MIELIINIVMLLNVSWIEPDRVESSRMLAYNEDLTRIHFK